jgi:hypothetical protein
MYSTSSEQTRTTWAAHTTNVSFTDEIGHFENCTGPTPIPATPFGLDANGNPVTCPAGNVEGSGSNTSPTDGDDEPFFSTVGSTPCQWAFGNDQPLLVR